ncbi:EI24 domain-containing protein [Amaricoccus solimangrovi]|uniref:Sulfate transporter family protein n=1 Tax=Amaricoccus solimangrovi TaxID=2589815 RepID=A0A501WPV3_9RHOB|nr:EI24 domain-containing protein [Amaricoccus solimangrovi]TPE51489.1 hypothetical protein FJM51_09650 [Amaricoccus solimangrovi]
MGLVVDFGRALEQMGDRRFLRVLVRSLAITVLGLALLFWAVMLGLGWLLPPEVTLPWVGRVSFIDNLVSWAAVGLMLALSVVLMVPVAAGVVGFFLDEVAAAVEARHYPALPPVTALPIGQQIGDALRFAGVVLGVNVVAFALYLAFPPLAPAVFVMLNGYLLGREYFQLVAARRLGFETARRLGKRHFWRIWVAGMLMAAPLTVPLLNLLVPIFGVAVFTHQFHRLERGGRNGGGRNGGA